MIEILKSVLFGIIEGITEWLPISSTGHLIILEKFVNLDFSEDFIEVYRVVIQLGAIAAVAVLYWKKINPFRLRTDGKAKRLGLDSDVMTLWYKIIVTCIPAVFVGVFLDDLTEKWFYNFPTVAAALIVFGILFLFIEKQSKEPTCTELTQITYKNALYIGVWQMIAAIFPGTSRSGATIIGGLFAGVSRPVATEYTFLLGVPVMFGASALKLFKYWLENGLSFTSLELGVLAVGVLVSFVISIFALSFLVSYVKKHTFKPFAWYRIVLGAILIVYYVITVTA